MNHELTFITEKISIVPPQYFFCGWVPGPNKEEIVPLIGLLLYTAAPTNTIQSGFPENSICYFSKLNLCDAFHSIPLFSFKNIYVLL